MSKPWTDMSPRERDALVAEKVMNLPLHRATITGFNTSVENVEWHEPRGAKPYTTDIAAAWEVVEKMPISFTLMRDSFSWIVTVRKSPSSLDDVKEVIANPIEVRAETAPEAICLAALKAVGYSDTILPDDSESHR